MKVLYDQQIFTAQKFGGISRYFNEISKMHSDNLEIEKINPDLFNVKYEVIKNDIVSRGVRYIKRKTGNTSPKELSTSLPFEAERLLRSNSFDVFHPTYYDPYFLDKINKPFVLTVYDMIHEIYKEQFSLLDQTSHNKMILCEKASKIIAISQQTKRDLMNIFDISEEKIEVTLLASDFALVVPSKPTELTHLNKYILFVGSRGGYKNFYFMIMALSSILKNDKNIYLLCTGHLFNNEELAFFKDFGVDDQIISIYLKNDCELAWAYQNAELFIFPSMYEGFGLPILEAFASNCPVVSSTGGSLPEVGGDAALYFDPKNILEMQSAVNSCLYNLTVKEDLIAKGKKRLAEFSWDKCRVETLAIYNSVNN